MILTCSKFWEPLEMWESGPGRGLNPSTASFSLWNHGSHLALLSLLFPHLENRNKDIYLRGLSCHANRRHQANSKGTINPCLPQHLCCCLQNRSHVFSPVLQPLQWVFAAQRGPQPLCLGWPQKLLLPTQGSRSDAGPVLRNSVHICTVSWNLALA